MALIPARVGSKGIPHKNFRPFSGGMAPVEMAVGCSLDAGIQHVVVSSDCDGGAFSWKYSGAHVEQLYRPAELAQDDTPMIDVVKHALAAIPGPPEQIILLVQPTQPLREPKHLQQAIALLQEHPGASVVSVAETPKEYSPELMCWIGGLSGYLCPLDVKNGLLGGDPRAWHLVPSRRQDAHTFYRREGTVYGFRRETIEEYGNIYGPIVWPLIIPASETCALDTPEDWAHAEALLAARR